MKANDKKRMERSIKEIVAIGNILPVLTRDNGQEIGQLTVESVTSSEIRGTVAGNRGFNGWVASFRVPQLTQRGGDNRIDISTKLETA